MMNPSTPATLKEAKQKLEKGFEELAKQLAEAGAGASDPAAAAAAAAGSAQANPENGRNRKRMILSMRILKSLMMKAKPQKNPNS